MFGKNQIEKRTDTDGLTLALKEVFFTIQGEGPHAGRPAIFIRLAGCHLACVFCDTAFDQGVDVDIREIQEQANGLWPFGAGTRATHYPPPLIVLTGGEPTRQNIDPLVECLIGDGWTVQIETAGTFYRSCMEDPECEVVVSPKTSFVHPAVGALAVAWKYVVDHRQALDSDGLPVTDTQGRGHDKALAKPTHHHYQKVWLSPMDCYNDDDNQKNLQLVAALSMKHGYRAGVQLHKLFRLA